MRSLTSNTILITVFAVTIPTSTCVAQCQTCKECAQLAIENAMKTQSDRAEVAGESERLRKEHIELRQELRELITLEIERLKSKAEFDCKTETVSGTYGRSPEIIARIPDNDKRKGYVVVSGGCSLTGREHNPTFLWSKQVEGGWSCLGGDQPNIPVNVQVTTQVIYCRFSWQ